MRHIFCLIAALSLIFSSMTIAAPESAAQLRIQSGPGGLRITIGKKKRFKQQRILPRAQGNLPANGSGSWEQRSDGAQVCNTTGEAYACVALRCSAERGMEWAFLFNRGEYGQNPMAQFGTDKGFTRAVAFSELEAGRTLVAPFDPVAHSDLTEALRAGSSLQFDIGFSHRFSLRGSSKALQHAFEVCEYEGFDPGQPVTVNQGTQGLDGTGGARLATAGGSDDLSWREDDTEESYVARIRAAAVPYGGPCDEEQAVFERLQRDIKVEIDKTEVKAGEYVTVNWSGNTLDQLLPAYLMVATDAAVRFKGEGFYALMPNAIGPFGIETFKKKTRAIVPLYGKGAQKAGAIPIEGVLAGRMPLEFAVIGWQRKCQSETAQVVSLGDVKVRPASAPVIDLDDRFAVEQPDKYLINADGTRLIDERDDGTWRLLDGTGLQLLLLGTGQHPRFSATGRFVVSRTDKGKSIHDAADGALVGYGSDVWLNHDSFVLEDFGRGGVFEALNPLHLGISYGGGASSNAASGEDSPTRFDQENAVQITRSHFASYINRLDNPKVEVELPGNQFGDASISALQNEIKAFAITKIDFPENWDTPGGKTILHKPYLLRDGSEDAGNGAELADFLKTYLEPRIMRPTSLALYKTEQLGIGANELISRDVRAFLSPVNSLVPNAETMDSIGFQMAQKDPATDMIEVSAELENGSDEIDAISHTIAKRITIDVPTAANELPVDDRYFWACDRPFDIARRYVVAGKPLWLTQVVCQRGSGLFFNSTLSLFRASAAGSIDTNPLYDKSSTSGVDCAASLIYCPVNSALFSERYLLIWSQDARAVAVVDGLSDSITSVRFDLPRGDLLESVAMTTDERHLLQQNSDGTFYVHRIADGETVLEGRIVDDEVIVWTPDMRFDSTAEGAHFVNLRFPGQIGQYTFQQFDSRLRVPGLVQQVLTGEYKPQPLEVGVPPRLTGALEVADGRILGAVVPESLGSLRGIRVYQDGIHTDSVFALESGEPVEIDVERKPGARWVSLVAQDEEGLVSLPIGRDMGADRSLANVRLLAVGVDQYDDERIQDLGLARADANTLAESLDAANGKTIALGERTVLGDGEATPEAVLGAAEKLVQASQPGEHAVFFFAGHGVKGEDGRFYMATSNTDPENISGTALSWDELSAVLARSKARMTVFLDACHSGAAGTDFFATNDDAASGILKNIPSGLTVFSASKGRELSQESAELGGGQFTKAVADVIAGNREAHDLNKNGVIEVSELYVGVKRQVVERTQGSQTPWLARNQMVGDFALF